MARQVADQCRLIRRADVGQQSASVVAVAVPQRPAFGAPLGSGNPTPCQRGTMEVVDLPGALEIIDEAITAIDAFDAVYRKASDNEGPAFQRYWDESLEVEQTAVLPRLDR